MKKILMIATGGTIACMPSENGLIPNISGSDIISLVPELKNICTIDTLELLNIDSSNISPKHYVLMIEALEKNYDLYDGFVITHGTDTMAYSSSFVTCAITNLNKPVVFTGSQLPLKIEGSDAYKNIKDAFLAASDNVYGVFLAFNGDIHYGDSVKKVYSENFTGFLSINSLLAGKSDNNKIIWNKKYEKHNKKPVFNKNISEKVFVLKIIPSLKPDIIDVLINMGYKSIIIEGYGAGGLPTEDCENNFIPALKKAIENNVSVICATQCLYDGVHLDKYPMGILAEKYGAVSSKNMTLEKTLAKTMLALGNNMDLIELKKYLENN